MKFTFRKEQNSHYGAFQRNFTDIKLNKKVVGVIRETQEYRHRIRFAIKKKKTTKDPAPFKWIAVGKDFENEKKAREFIKQHSAAIQKSYDLYSFDD